MSHAGQSRTNDQQEPAIVENVVANMQEPAGLPPQKRFMFLAKKRTTPVTTEASLLTPEMKLASYIAEYQAGKITTCGFEFWQQNQLVYPVLAPLALDLISMLASEAYFERVFSLCGDLCARKRNRLSRSLVSRVFLKMNDTVL